MDLDRVKGCSSLLDDPLFCWIGSDGRRSGGIASDVQDNMAACRDRGHPSGFCIVRFCVRPVGTQDHQPVSRGWSVAVCRLWRPRMVLAIRSAPGSQICDCFANFQAGLLFCGATEFLRRLARRAEKTTCIAWYDRRQWSLFDFPPLCVGVPDTFNEQPIQIRQGLVAVHEEPETFAICLARPLPVPRLPTRILRMEVRAPEC